jgi:uncharacterized protein
VLKILVLLAILAVVILVFFGRGRRKDVDPGQPPARPPQAQPRRSGPAEKVPMLACAHCGVHLPRDEAAFDVAGQPYCTPEHRVAGPR